MVPPSNGQIIYDALGSADKHLLYLDNSDHVVTMDHEKEKVFEAAWNFIRSEGKSL
jgi:carboxylesterase